MEEHPISRRRFFAKATALGVAGNAIPSIITSCTNKSKRTKVELPLSPDRAPDGPLLKAGLIGCGGRGSGAAINFLNAGPNLKITALGDTFKDRIDACRERLLKEKAEEVPLENCFVGFDAYQKVIESGVDIVILATPPYFRPEHMAAAINAKKNVFAEKPVCVDPVGARSVMVTARRAKEMDLSIVTGTQRRHSRTYLATWQQIAQGAIGEITGGCVYWNGGKLWHRDANPDWSEMEYMIRNWVNWGWLSGDHIVEQHVHNLDVMNWFSGSHPIKAVGFGSRLRRVTGDQFDNFSVDYTFENGIHFHSMCRQIDGCVNNISELIQGTKGSTNCADQIMDLNGKKIWEYAYPKDKDGKPDKSPFDAFGQEHRDLVTGIRTGKPVNEAENTAISSLVAIMGRISSYTGKEVTWEEMMNSDMKLGPKVFAFGPVDITKEIPLPGVM